ncbi:MAG TPA: ACP phosphodiesterase [Flavisolibacter sp.]|nr:ACP phosphodiesterase [Flavisolibacter sp.]
MISDFVKGAAKDRYANDVRQGIMLHRYIDEYTDNHPATKHAKEIFRPYYRLYSGAIIDILYDHFLANDTELFTEASLKNFTRSVYIVLQDQSAHLPEHFIPVLAYMSTEDWLYHYRYTSGMQKSLRGLIRRAAYLSESDTAYQLFLDNYKAIEECYKEFFPDVKQFAKQRFNELLG